MLESWIFRIFDKQYISCIFYLLKFDEAGQNLKTESLIGHYITASSSTINVY